MEITTSYSNLIISNAAIWGQAIMVGMIIVGSACLMGIMVSFTVKIFRMISR